MSKDAKKTGEVMKVKRDYLSRKDLHAMAVGQTIEFCIPQEKLESATSACNNMKYQGKRFSKKTIVNGDESSIIVTRTE